MVIGSENIDRINKTEPGRYYDWGAAKTEQHGDMKRLREFITNNLDEIKTKTQANYTAFLKQNLLFLKLKKEFTKYYKKYKDHLLFLVSLEDC